MSAPGPERLLTPPKAPFIVRCCGGYTLGPSGGARPPARQRRQRHTPPLADATSVPARSRPHSLWSPHSVGGRRRARHQSAWRGRTHPHPRWARAPVGGGVAPGPRHPPLAGVPTTGGREGALPPRPPSPPAHARGCPLDNPTSSGCLPPPPAPTPPLPHLQSIADDCAADQPQEQLLRSCSRGCVSVISEGQRQDGRVDAVVGAYLPYSTRTGRGGAETPPVPREGSRSMRAGQPLLLARPANANGSAAGAAPRGPWLAAASDGRLHHAE